MNTIQREELFAAFTEALSKLGETTNKPDVDGRMYGFTFEKVDYWLGYRDGRLIVCVETVRHGNDWFTKWSGSERMREPSITMAPDKAPTAQAKDFINRLHKREGIAWWAEAQGWLAAQETAQAQKESAIAELVSATPGVRKNTWNDGISAPNMTLQYSSDGKFTLNNLYRSLTVDQVKRIAAIVAEAA